MKRTFGLILALLWLGLGIPVLAAEPASTLIVPVPDLLARLTGNTLSAVAYIPHRPGAPGGGELTRLMLQAYLGPGGRALVRVWDPGHDAYTVPRERKWTLTGSTLCVDVPAPGNGPLCADVHVWGPRIAGMGVNPYAMLDGDLKPGNIIAVRR